MSRLLGLAVVLVLPMSLSAGDDAVAKELKALKGKWKAVSVEAMGMKFGKDAVPPFTFVADAEGKAVGEAPGGELRFTMTVDPTKKPKTIENDHTGGDQKGKKQYGIYKLEGDTLTVCITPPGRTAADRPKDFTTKGTTNVLFVFERVKEEKKP